MNKLPSFVEKVLRDYVSQMTAAYPNLIEGVYITGSVALGDYYSKKSDIDFMTVLKEIPPEDLLRRLKHIHLNIEKAYGRPKLNGYYVTMKGIKRGQKSFPSFFKNRLQLERPFELDKVSLLEWKEFSYCVCGIPAVELPLDVQLRDVMAQLHQNINSYWTSWIRRYSPVSFNYVLLMLFPRLTEWGILGVARQLYTLETGMIASKLNAGTYCLDKLPDNLKGIMRQAIAVRRINKTQLRPSFKRAGKTLTSMRYIISEFNKVYSKTEGHRSLQH